MTENKGLAKAYILAIVAITAWGFSFIWEDFLIKNNIGIFTFIFERMLLAALIMWTVGGLILRSVQSVKKKDVKWMFLLAFGEPFIYFLGENFGIKYTSGVMAAIIIATIPLFCMVIDRLLYKFKLTLPKVLGCVMALLGIVLFVMEKKGGGATQTKGILLLLLSVAGALIYSYITKSMCKRYNPVTIVTWQFTFGTVLFLPLFLAFGLKGLTPYYLSSEVQLKILALAVLCSCICFGIWAYSTGKLGVTRVSVFSALIPLVSATVAYFLYPGQETFTLLKVAGIILTILGVIVVQIVKDVKRI